MNNKIDLNVSYISQCKQNYFLGITPNCDNCQTKQGYIELEQIAVANINEHGVLSFSGYFQEYQYLIDLWTAHFIWKHSNCDDEWRNKCLSIIKSYARSSLSERISREESLWLASNGV